jgi:hypothetical protein
VEYRIGRDAFVVAAGRTPQIVARAPLFGLLTTTPAALVTLTPFYVHQITVATVIIKELFGKTYHIYPLKHG